VAGGGGHGALTGSSAEVLATEALPPARRSAPWAVVVVALAVAAVSLALALSSLLLGDRGTGSADRARDSALEAARQRTTVLTSYDHRRLDTDFAAVLETATGEFERDYQETTGQLRTTFERTKAVAVGTVVAAGLEDLELDADGRERAVAVVAVDQVIATAGAAPRTERNRVRMVLVRPDDTWLVESVQRL
jgi:Mce-associated membrane protein